MIWSEFKSSLESNSPPRCSPLLTALWWDKKGRWEKSHIIAQDIYTKEGSWVHAYLHRKEGDTWNADYWYGKAGKSRPSINLDKEWESLVKHFLDQ